jgi:uncharacterized protein (DUF1501 family)
MVTTVPAAIAPAGGLNVGVATCASIVYGAVPTVLFAIPVSYAMALIVSAALTVTDTGDADPPEAAGVDPLVV